MAFLRRLADNGFVDYPIEATLIMIQDDLEKGATDPRFSLEMFHHHMTCKRLLLNIRRGVEAIERSYDACWLSYRPMQLGLVKEDAFILSYWQLHLNYDMIKHHYLLCDHWIKLLNTHLKFTVRYHDTSKLSSKNMEPEDATEDSLQSCSGLIMHMLAKRKAALASDGSRIH